MKDAKCQLFEIMNKKCKFQQDSQRKKERRQEFPTWGIKDRISLQVMQILKQQLRNTINFMHGNSTTQIKQTNSLKIIGYQNSPKMKKNNLNISIISY